MVAEAFMPPFTMNAAAPEGAPPRRFRTVFILTKRFVYFNKGVRRMLPRGTPLTGARG